MFKLSKREVAKFAANMATIGTAAVVAETALNTAIGDEGEDATSIHTGSLMIGAVVGFHTRRVTDKVVDMVADRRIARKERKSQTAEVAAV
jgi:hypothetical protein